jgi:hypothetical protein
MKLINPPWSVLRLLEVTGLAKWFAPLG